MIKLRPYQAKAKNDIYLEWGKGVINVLAVLPTGAGKTVTFSDIVKEHTGANCAIAHRQELVSQISLALAKDGVKHKIIGPKSVIKLCVMSHMNELGRSFYDPMAQCAVAGVDTLVRREKQLKQWLQKVTLWVMDEAHHVLKCNKWGTAVEMFPNAKGLGVTATPKRADGKGLADWNDGLFQSMVEGPTMRQLINMGYLTDYRIFAPPSDLDLSDVNVTASGELNAKKTKLAIRKSTVVGDVIKHYLRIAPGKLGVTFATDVETATDIAKWFNDAGVPAAVVSAKTPDAERIAVLAKFKRRELLQLVNVDLFGEGFDLPAIEVVSMARPTMSFALFVQQFGRALRLMIDPSFYPTWDILSDEDRRRCISESKKPHAIIIDHVGNVNEHGLPDAVRNWTLEGRSKRKGKQADDVIPVTTCLNDECLAVYERIYKACPFCGHVNEPAGRSEPDQVDGDLIELDAATLAMMRGEVDKVDMTVDEFKVDLASRYVPTQYHAANIKRHLLNQEAQAALRASIAWWGGYQRAQGRTDSEIYRLFFFTFNIDMMSAQSLKVKEALPLAEAINYKIGELWNECVSGV